MPGLGRRVGCIKIVQDQRKERADCAICTEMDGERCGHALGVALQNSWHARPTAPRRVRSGPASNFRTESRARIILLVLWPNLAARSRRACANKNPAGGAPRRGDCSPGRGREGPPSPRADLGDPLTKASAGRFDSRLWNPESLLVL